MESHCFSNTFGAFQLRPDRKRRSHGSEDSYRNIQTVASPSYERFSLLCKEKSSSVPVVRRKEDGKGV
jgi:hypothetical protein